MSADCLFCSLYAEGEHVRKAGGFVAVKDINPRAETHLLGGEVGGAEGPGRVLAARGRDGK